MARIRYNRADLGSTMAAACRLATDEPVYVFATALGYTIDRNPPAFKQQHYIVQPQAFPQFVNPYADEEATS